MSTGLLNNHSQYAPVYVGLALSSILALATCHLSFRNDDDIGSFRQDGGPGINTLSSPRALKPPQFLQDFYQDITEEAKGRDDDFITKVLARTWSPIATSVQGLGENETLVEFQQTEGREGFGSFRSASLVITRLSPESKPKFTLRLGGSDVPMKTNLNQSCLLKDSYLVMDVTKYLKSKLLKESELEEPYPILFKIVIHDDHFMKYFAGEFIDLQVDRPFILLNYEDEGKIRNLKKRASQRRKRSSKRNGSKNTDTSPGTNSKRTKACSKRNWTLQPADIHWEIIQPNSIDLGYCAGSCPFPVHDAFYNYSMHRFLIDRFRFIKGLHVHHLPESCCVPIRYEKVNVLEHNKKGEFQVTMLKKVSVKYCGCR